MRERGKRASAILLAVFLVTCAGLAARGGRDQQKQPQRPAPAGALPGDAAFVFNYIATGKTADFEAAMGRLKEALRNSAVPQRTQQAAGWKVFKTSDSAGEGQVLYVWVVDPVVKDVSYSVPVILSEAFPADVRTIYDSYLASFGRGQVRVGATLVTTMGQ